VKSVSAAKEWRTCREVEETERGVSNRNEGWLGRGLQGGRVCFCGGTWCVRVCVCVCVCVCVLYAFVGEIKKEQPDC